MRGKETAVFVSIFAMRITPAHAGKRAEAALLSGDVVDHPRTCGEKETA